MKTHQLTISERLDLCTTMYNQVGSFFSLAMIDYYLQDSIQYKTLLENNEADKDTKDYVYNKLSFILSKENAVSLKDCLRILKEYIEKER